MATLGTEDSGLYREVTVVKRFKQESMYGLSTKKVAVNGGSTVPTFQVNVLHIVSDCLPHPIDCVYNAHFTMLVSVDPITHGPCRPYLSI